MLACGMQCAGMVPRACLEGNMQKPQEIDLLENVPKAAAKRREAHYSGQCCKELQNVAEGMWVKVL